MPPHPIILSGLPKERFLAKVQWEPGPCWQWTGSLASRGYGVLFVHGQLYLAHRLSYWMYIGAIPDGHEVDHICRNRGCVSPAHLEAVTHRTNMLRGDTIVAAHARKTHCPKGHEYTPENIYWYAKRPRERRCRACRRGLVRGAGLLAEVR